MTGTTGRKFSVLLRKPVKILRKYHRQTKIRITYRHLVLFCMIPIILLLIFAFIGPPWRKRQITSEVPIITRSPNESLMEPNFPIWTRISDSVYTYSAFLDMRGIFTNKFTSRNIPISIIGLLKLPPKGPILREKPLVWYHIKDESVMNPSQYHCRVFYVNNVTGKFVSFQGESLTHKIFEEGMKVFAGTFLNCYINRTIAATLAGSLEGLSVSIYSSASSYPTKSIPIVTIPNESPKSSEMSPTTALTLCVRPLFGPMDDIVQLTQFIAFYSTMGVSDFNFYDFGLSPRAREELRKGSAFTGSKITIRKWNLPTGNWEELWDYGSLAALNDCVYRNMDKRWIIIVDIDEFLVPQDGITTTLQGLLLNSRFENYHQLLVRNTFFCKEFCLADDRQKELPIFSCLIRTKRIWNVNLRSKFIVYPRHVLQVGHHGVTRFLEPIVRRAYMQDPRTRSLSKSYTFPEKLLILNHYRECRNISTRQQPILERMTIVDTTILRFKEQILSKTTSANQSLIMNRR